MKIIITVLLLSLISCGDMFDRDKSKSHASQVNQLFKIEDNRTLIDDEIKLGQKKYQVLVAKDKQTILNIIKQSNT